MSDKAILHSHTKLVSILIVLIFFFQSGAICQSFDPTINATHWTVDGEVRQGFSTDFGFSAKDVEKGWWRFSRKFGRPLNMKTYCRVTIPGETNQGNVDIELLSKTLTNKEGSTFFLTVNERTIPETKKENYLNQVKIMLQDFKKSYYLSVLEDQLKKEEKKAKKLSKKVDRAGKKGKDRALNALTEQEKKLDIIRQRVKTIYKAY